MGTDVAERRPTNVVTGRQGLFLDNINDMGLSGVVLYSYGSVQVLYRYGSERCGAAGPLQGSMAEGGTGAVTNHLEAMAAMVSQLVQGLLAETSYSTMPELLGPIGFLRHALFYPEALHTAPACRSVWIIKRHKACGSVWICKVFRHAEVFGSAGVISVWVRRRISHAKVFGFVKS